MMYMVNFTLIEKILSLPDGGIIHFSHHGEMKHTVLTTNDFKLISEFLDEVTLCVEWVNSKLFQSFGDVAQLGEHLYGVQ